MNFKEATERLRGRYDEFAVAFAPRLRDVIFAPKGKKVTCPVHGVAKKFNVHPNFAENGKWYSYIEYDQPHGVFNLLAWATGASKKEILDFAAQYLDGEKPLSQAEIQRKEAQIKAKKKEEFAKNRRRLNNLWRTAHRGCTPEIVRYLSIHRGIHNLIPPMNVAFHPELYFNNDGARGKAPATLVRMDNPYGKAVALHRIYLDEDCKKSSLGKKMLPPSGDVMGAAARLYPFGEDGVLGIAEGVETAVAVTSFFGIPTWAAISAPMLGAFIPPKGVKTLVIWADKDRSGTGQNYAERLQERMKTLGIKVVYMLPTTPIPEGKKGVDWLDICYPN